MEICSTSENKQEQKMVYKFKMLHYNTGLYMFRGNTANNNQAKSIILRDGHVN